MIASHFPATISRPPTPHLPTIAIPTTFPFPFFLGLHNPLTNTKFTIPHQSALKWAVRLRTMAEDEEEIIPSLLESKGSSSSSDDEGSKKGSPKKKKPKKDKQKAEAFDAKELVDFLYEDLPHLFDDRGIDRSKYDENVKFRDPITRHYKLSGYLFNISMLRLLFNPKFHLHWVKQTGTYEITTRWTMVMKFVLMPWKPELIFTGTSVMGINPETKRFCSHVDYWDSIDNNDFFSIEGFMDVLKQFRIYKTPDLDTPKYKILKRKAHYEVRKYRPFIVAETKSNKLSGSEGFKDVTGYIFGKNSAEEKMAMTTPVFTQAFDPENSKVSIQVVLPSNKEMGSLPTPKEEEVSLREVEGGMAGVSKFSGEPTEDIIREKENVLRSKLVKDGLKPKPGCLLARYNDPETTKDFMKRNEVLIWLEEFSLD